MKITIATGIYPPEIGGPATYLRELVPVLKKKGWKVDVVTYGAPRAGIVAISRDSPFRWLKFLRATLRSARDSDVIFATDIFSAGFPAALVTWWLKKRLVTRYVGDFAWETARSEGWTQDPFNVFLRKKYGWRIELLRSVQKWVLRRSEIITVSNFSKTVLAKWGVGNATIISNAPSEVKLAARDVLRKQLGVSDKFVLLAVGRITPFKGVDKIIRMCSKLKNDIPELLLVVIGDGSALGDAEKAANEERLTHMVRFLGRQGDVETRKCMKAADVLIQNSEIENLSFTVLEAMSVKCPVVASEVGGNVELVKDRGLLFEYNDMDGLRNCVLKLYKDRGLGKKLAEKAFMDLPDIGKIMEESVRVLTGSRR